MSDYAELVQEVVYIAENASHTALQYFRTPILIEMKENMTPVNGTRSFIRGIPLFGTLVGRLIEEAGSEWFSFTGTQDLRETSFFTCAPALKRQILELGFL